ncbi:MAG: hypothetical protein JWO06_897 [Bacteroidota bacterium]|nr:hypothetical protein [Bacteroidota bacterium]
MKNYYLKQTALLFLVAVMIQNISAQHTQRIIGQRNNTYNSNIQELELYDSLQWTYSNGRGSLSIDNSVYDNKTDFNLSGPNTLSVEQFDAHNRMVVNQTKQWAFNNWFDQYRITNTYDASGNQTEQLQEQYTNNVWNDVARFDFIYDAHGDTTRYLLYLPDSTNWVLRAREDFGYDNLYRHSTDFQFDLDVQGQITDTSFGFFYTYDAFGNLAQLLRETVDTTLHLVPDYQYIYTYDSAQLQSNTRQTYTNGSWMFYSELVYYYNGLGQLSEMRTLSSDGSGGSVPAYNSLYNYNSSGLLDTMWNQNYNPITVNFDNSGRQVYQYNSQNLDTADEFSIPDSVGNWHLQFKNQFQYDTAGNMTYRLFSMENDISVTPYSEYFYWYENYQLISGIKPTEPLSLNVYPNPAHGSFNLDFNEGAFQSLKLLNYAGQNIMEQEITPLTTKMTISSSHLNAGVYLLQMNGKDESVTRKIIID